MADYRVSIEPENSGCFSMIAGVLLLGVILHSIIDCLGNYP